MVKYILVLENCLEYLEDHHSKTIPLYYMLLSSFLNASNTLLSKQLPGVPTEEQLFIRAIVMLTINSTFISTQKLDVYRPNINLTMKLILRSIVGCIGTLLFYKSLKYLPLSEGVVLYRTSPLWTTIMSIAYLKKEKFGLSLMVFIVTCLVGITLIAQPPFLSQIIYGVNTISHEHHLLGVGLVILGSMLSSCVQILINSMASEVHQIIILQYFSFISLMVPVATLFIQSKQLIIPDQKEMVILIMIGLTAYFSQLLMNRAYMKGNLSEVSMIGQTQVLFSYLFDILLLGQQINFLSILGGIFIVSTLVSMVIRKSKKQQTLPK
ncbi:hypothetical protein pb186bvf_018648 [Paramecium bursaria]